jgi:hypothetical protein
MTEEQVFDEFGLEPEPSSARAIVTRLQQAELEMKPSVSARGEHEMTLRLLEEEPDEEDHGGKYADNAGHIGDQTYIDVAAQTDAPDPAPGAPTTQEATELPPPPNRKGGMSRRQIGMVVVLVGVVAALLAVLANPLGIGHAGFGWKQGVLLGVGILLIIAGGVAVVRSPNSETGAAPPPR